MRVEPATHFINWQQDPQSNYLARLVFPDKTTSFRIEIDLVAEMSVLNPFDFFLEPSAEHFPFKYAPELLTELEPYLIKSPSLADAPAFQAYVASISREKTATNDFLVSLNQKLQRDIAYLVRMEPGVQTPEETLTKASGSCRDTGWLLVQLLRHLGLAARFVSGYLIQLKSDVKSLDGPSGTEIDFTDLHAWCEVYPARRRLDRAGPDLGPARRRRPHSAGLLARAIGSAAPVSGAIDECETTFEHSMSVSARVGSAARDLAVHRSAVEATIDTLGHQVDADLRKNDVRLTQGGEPTFVSVDDREGAEWNTEAMGPTKRLLERRADGQAPRQVRRGRPAALRPGQVVSGRAACRAGR